MDIVSGNDVLMVSPILVLLFTGLLLMLLDAFKIHQPLGWVAHWRFGFLRVGFATRFGRYGRHAPTIFHVQHDAYQQHICVGWLVFYVFPDFLPSFLWGIS